MDREAELRDSLSRTLHELGGERSALDLVEEIPLLEAAIESVADARIAQARAGGASWADIASRLGVSRQAVHKRFSMGSKPRQGPHLEIRLERKKRSTS